MKITLYEKLLIQAGEKMVKRRVNTCCGWFYYQAKLPKSAEKYKKK